MFGMDSCVHVAEIGMFCGLVNKPRIRSARKRASLFVAISLRNTLVFIVVWGSIVDKLEMQ